MRRGATRRPALLAMLVVGALAALALSAPLASAATFDHWPGSIAINYDYNGKLQATNLQKLLKVVDPSALPTPLGTTIEDLWQKSSSGKNPPVCNDIRNEVADVLKQPTPLAGWSCSLPPSGDVEGGLEGSNVLGIDFLLHGIALTFDVNDAYGTASAELTADIDFHVDLDFAPTVDGASKSTTAALSIGSSSVRVTGGTLSAQQFGITQGALEPYANEIESLDVQNVAGWVGLPAEIAQENRNIESGAHLIYSQYVQPSDPDANQVFNLSIGVSRTNLTLTFDREPLQPAPKDCTFYADAGPSGTGVEAMCSPHQPKGVTKLLLEDHDNGKWGDNPQDSTIEPGAPGGPEWATLGPAPYPTWEPNAGADLGYAPDLVDYPTTKSGVTTVEMRVCSSNEWGLTCDAPVKVTGYTAGGSGAGTGGGGGGGGGGGATGGSINSGNTHNKT
jgi:hypothetical protein